MSIANTELKGCLKDMARLVGDTWLSDGLPFTRIIVPGEPVGQPRMRTSGATFKSRGGKSFSRLFTPADADGWKNRVFIAAGPHQLREPHLGPVEVSIVWYFSRPKYLLEAGAPDLPIPYTAKPDRDNLDKSTLDALSERTFWRDDAQVFQGTIAKFWVARGYEPGAIIAISFHAPQKWHRKSKPRARA